MNTKDMTREQISAFADGELADSQVDLVLASLRQAETRANWELYHQIGDVLRSGDMSMPLSKDFSVRMSAALDAEPVIVAPAVKNSVQSSEKSVRPKRRWGMPEMIAVAAVSTAAYIATPQLMIAMKGTASASSGTIAASGSIKAAHVPPEPLVAAESQEAIVLRDPRIDDYLLAHQRFSPSVYSTAQYARSATFANDSNK